MVYELIVVPTVTYFENGFISFYSDEYTFSGGAHGSTIRSSQNWDLMTGLNISLWDLFPQEDYLLMILKEMNQQIAEQTKNGTNQYFDNSCQLVLDTFKMDQFYFTKNDVIIYFQQYDIAPYSSGIPTFEIPHN